MKQHRDSIRQKTALIALALLLAPYFSFALNIAAVYAQTKPAQSQGNPNADWNTGDTLSQQAQQTDSTVPDAPYTQDSRPTNLIQQAAEQAKDQLTLDAMQGITGSPPPDANPIFEGIYRFWQWIICGQFFQNIGHLIAKWMSEVVIGWLAPTVKLLSGLLYSFVLNPNIAVNGVDGKQDDISNLIRQAADVMYSIAVDLLLLLFICCIWKYWTEATWRGGGNMLGAVGRLICTAGLLIAWPTIYAFIIQISNEMIRAIYFTGADNIVNIDEAIYRAILTGMSAIMAFFIQGVAPVGAQGLFGFLMPASATAVAATGGSAVGGAIAFVAMLIFTILSTILVVQLIVLLLLKAIQMAILVAQYMFAPIFLVFFAVPDTEMFCVAYVRAFCQVSLWTFVWVGLLRLLATVMYSQYVPWGKILMIIGILQMMIQVPVFMAHGGAIEPRSFFLSPEMLMTPLMGAARGFREGFTSLVSGLAKSAFNPSMGFAQTASAAMPNAGPGFTPLPGGPSGPTAGGGSAPPAGSGGNVNVSGANLNTGNTAPGPNISTGANVNTGATSTAANANLATPNNGPGSTNVSTSGASTNVSGSLLTNGTANVAQGQVDPLATQGMAAQGLNIAQPMGQGGPQGFIDPPNTNPPYNVFQAETANKAPIRNLVKNVKDGDFRLAGSPDGTNSVYANGKGEVAGFHINSNSPLESQAELFAVSAYAKERERNPVLGDAARQAALDEGAHLPQGGLERALASVHYANGGGRFSDTDLSKHRFARAQFRAAVRGAHAYMNEQPGNAYTGALNDMYGAMTPERRQEVYTELTSAGTADSPWHPDFQNCTDFFAKNSVPFSSANRAAYSNPYVKSLAPSKKRHAVIALGQYLDQNTSGLDGIAKSFAMTNNAANMSNPEAEVIIEASNSAPPSSSSSGVKQAFVNVQSQIKSNPDYRVVAGSLYANGGFKNAHEVINVMANVQHALQNNGMQNVSGADIQQVIHRAANNGFTVRQMADVNVVQMAHHVSQNNPEDMGYARLLAEKFQSSQLPVEKADVTHQITVLQMMEEDGCDINSRQISSVHINAASRMLSGSNGSYTPSAYIPIGNGHNRPRVGPSDLRGYINNFYNQP